SSTKRMPTRRECRSPARTASTTLSICARASERASDAPVKETTAREADLRLAPARALGISPALRLPRSRCPRRRSLPFRGLVLMTREAGQRSGTLALLFAPVSADDRGDDRMPDDVAFVQVHKLDAFDPLQDASCREQPGRLVVRKIDLRDVA